MRYFFEIAYNGTNYNGWQSQQNAVGVQTIVENALSKLLREDIRIVGAAEPTQVFIANNSFFTRIFNMSLTQKH